MERRLEINYQHYTSQSQMERCDSDLIKEARVAATRSYSPYSKFKVGAALRLQSGRIIYGANIESEVYPAGLCAERTALFAAAANYPDDAIQAIAITSLTTDSECYPCGECRQVLVDSEHRQGSSIRVVMAGRDTATVVETATMLLPFTFNLER